MEQARVAMCHAFHTGYKTDLAPILPTGIYTIPEVSMVGAAEEDLKAKGVDYVVGRASYAHCARGEIIGDQTGFLKLIFRRDDMKLLGVHVIGEQATEVVHVGVIAMLADATAELFNRSCFNFPTLGDLYKIATYNAYRSAGRPAAGRPAGGLSRGARPRRRAGLPARRPSDNERSTSATTPAGGGTMATATEPTTIADLLEGLGGIPARRVALRPHARHRHRARPDPSSMTARNRRYELVDGTLVEKAVGFDESIFGLHLAAALVGYLRTHDLGKTVGANALMRLFPGLVRVPDAAFISWERYPRKKRRAGEIPTVAPDLVVEVLSKGQHAQGDEAQARANTSGPASGWSGTSTRASGP